MKKTIWPIREKMKIAVTAFAGYARRQNQLSIVISAVTLVGILGIADVITGYEIAFSIFYLAPVCFATWFAGKRAGLALSLLSAITWLVADVASGHTFTHPAIPIWNAAVRFGFFVITVFIMDELHIHMENQAKLIRDLSETQNEVKVLAGLIPICAWCKKIRDDNGYWQQVETYVTEHSEVSFTHSICPECKRKWNEELRKFKHVSQSQG